jgi:hypothetical protein
MNSQSYLQKIVPVPKGFEIGNQTGIIQGGCRYARFGSYLGELINERLIYRGNTPVGSNLTFKREDGTEYTIPHAEDWNYNYVNAI